MDSCYEETLLLNWKMDSFSFWGVTRFGFLGVDCHCVFWHTFLEEIESDFGNQKWTCDVVEKGCDAAELHVPVDVEESTMEIEVCVCLEAENEKKTSTSIF